MSLFAILIKFQYILDQLSQMYIQELYKNIETKLAYCEY